jgi:hypothetical protein
MRFVNMEYWRYAIDVKAEDCEKARAVLERYEQQRDIEVYGRGVYWRNGCQVVRFGFSCIGGEEDYQKVTDELKDILL